MPVSKFTPSCLSPTWTSKTLMFLGRYERTYAHRLPGTELRSRALRKLARAKASSTAHLAVLVHRVVKQVLIDYGKEVSRHYEHFEYDFTVDFPEPEKGLPPFLQDRLEDLLADDSPLDPSEKHLFRTALEDPVAFVGPNGPNHSALARHLGVNQSTISRRWEKMLEKVATWRSAPERTAPLSPPAISI